jgi:3-hydroxyacyl-CoA dehydrogenase
VAVAFEQFDTVGVVTIDNPPVNAIGQAVRTGLMDAMDKALAANVRRLIVTGRGRTFAAGADAAEFDREPEPPHLNDVLMRLGSFPLPTIAAINGAALGGGLEIALACRIRISSPRAVLGMPEVTLGVVPGAGGTQRLPRLIGMAAALDMITTGKATSAEQALSLGLLDAVEEDPVRAAKSFDQASIAKVLPTDLRPPPAADQTAEAGARARAAKSPHLDAPLEAINLVAASAHVSLLEGLARERRTFLALRGSDKARALRHVFFAERAAISRGKQLGNDGRAVSTAVVVGGGNMGAAIAYAIAATGIEVIVVESDVAGLNRAQANTARLVDEGAKRGAISAAQAKEILVRMNCVAGYDALPPADIAIEAAFEDMDVKRDIFGKLQAKLPPETILASNTSYLDINQMARGIDGPERFLGLHFFNPAHVMKLVEIVPSDHTSSQALGTAFKLATRLNKVPVLAGVCDGFIGNRILARYRNAADVLLLEGALPAEIDQAMRAYGMAMGPYEAQDLSGLDIGYANRKRQNLSERKDIRYISIADRMVEDLDRLGRKSKAGWYDYPKDGKPVASPDVADLISRSSDLAGIERRPFADDEIVDRLTLAMTAEAITILDDGIAERPQDIDLVLIHGYGYPRWRGGLMYAADRVAPHAIAARISALNRLDPLSWVVPPLLDRMVRERKAFDSLNQDRERRQPT